MQFEEFQQTLQKEKPDPSLSDPLKALWYDGNGQWERAHDLIQDAMSGDEAWVHAYLHRKEGDIGNADYWYRRAGKSRPDSNLEEEWEFIVQSLLP